MATIRIRIEDILKSKGETDKTVVDNMTEADIKRGILADEDTPNLTDEELDEFKRVPEGGESEKD
jgi:hypothetical protein